MPYKLFVLRIVSWSYNCLQVSIIVSYLKPYKWVETNDLLDRNDYLVWFGLVSLFYGISTFVGYLMPKPFS